MRFHDRERERTIMKNALDRENCFIVITGRRRIGKTRLAREVLKTHDHLDLFIPRKRMALAVEQLSRSIREQTGYSPDFKDLRSLLEYILRMDNKTIFLDEISNLDHVEKGAYSDIQELYDRYRDQKNIHLIVTGSFAGIMKRIFEDRKEPLFGRPTNILKLAPLSVSDSVKVLMESGIDLVDSLEMYSLIGGVPRYLELFRDYRDLTDMIDRIFSPRSIFLYEGQNVLIQEFGSSWDTYFSILEVISRGKMGPTSIADQLGMEVQMLPKYLEKLKGLELVIRRRPIFGKQRHVRYQISDPFFSFWFSHCYPRMEMFMADRTRPDMQSVKTYIGKAMEKVMIDIMFRSGSFPFTPDEVGAWWDRSGNEIDILFYNNKEKKIGVGEVKWRKKMVTVKEVKDLLEKTDMIDWHNNKRIECPFIISRNGFRDDASDLMKDSGVKGIDMEDIRSAVLAGKSFFHH